MVAERHPGIDPLLEQRDACFALAGHFELPLVDESDGRRLVTGEHAQQLGRRA